MIIFLIGQELKIRFLNEFLLSNKLSKNAFFKNLPGVEVV